MERQTRILVVDDQALYREGLVEIIGHWPEFKVVGEAGNGLEAVRFCEENQVDIVLMDVRMPVMDGIEAAGIIVGRHPSVVVIMLTVDLEDAHLFSALSNGAKGYVLKDMPSRQLRDRLGGVMRGEAAVSGAVAARMVERLARQPYLDLSSARKGSALSDREVQIFKLVARGLSNEEIAAQLYLSPGTVKKQLRALMQKYGLENRVQIAAYAIRTGISD